MQILLKSKSACRSFPANASLMGLLFLGSASLMANELPLQIKSGQTLTIQLQANQSRKRVQIEHELDCWHVLEIEARNGQRVLDLGMRIFSHAPRTVDDDLGSLGHHERLIMLEGPQPEIEIFSLSKLTTSVLVQVQLRPVALQQTLAVSNSRLNVPPAGLYIPSLLIPQNHTLKLHPNRGNSRSTLRQFRLLKINRAQDRIVTLRSSRKANFTLTDAERSPDHFIEIIAPPSENQLSVAKKQEPEQKVAAGDPQSKLTYISGLRDNLPLERADPLHIHRRLNGSLTKHSSGIVHRFTNHNGPALIDLQGQAGDLCMEVRFNGSRFAIDYDVGGNPAHEMLVLPFKGDYELIVGFSEDSQPSNSQYRLFASYPDVHRLPAGSQRIHSLGVFHLQMYEFNLHPETPLILDVKALEKSAKQNDLILTVYQLDAQGKIQQRRLDHDLGGDPGQERVKLSGTGKVLVVVRRPPLSKGRLSYQIRTAKDPLASSDN